MHVVTPAKAGVHPLAVVADFLLLWVRLQSDAIRQERFA